MLCSLDLPAALAEGSAALLVLPYRGDGHGQEAEPAAAGGAAAAAAAPAALAALHYSPIAVVPPEVAAELCGLMGRMEQELVAAEAEAAVAAAGEGGGSSSTSSAMVRARAFTHSFSPFVSDMMSLLMGGNRFAAARSAAAATAVATASGGAAAPPDAAAQDLQEAVRHLQQLQMLVNALLSYMRQTHLPYTQQYMAAGLAGAGQQLAAEVLGHWGALQVHD